jgi:ribosomal protein L37E
MAGEQGRGARSDGDALTELANIVDACFPDLKCLRCGSESFFVAGPVPHSLPSAAVGGERKNRSRFAKVEIESADLICQRCGMIERHSLEILRRRLAAERGEPE